MFLSIREIRHNKFRYGLVITVIMLISYLIFILSALALGLANQNTAAVDAWQTNSVVISQDANVNLNQSLLNQKQVAHYQESDNENVALVATAPAVATIDSKRLSVNYIGLNFSEFIFRNLTLEFGKWPSKSNEVIVSDKLKNNGVKLHHQMHIGQSHQIYEVVGFVKNAEYNIAPIIYGKLENWHLIKGVSQQFVGSGIISKKVLSVNEKPQNTAIISKQTLINKMPGYVAQTTTFIFMIGFLVVISLIVVTIFLYILTMQKKQNFAVLRVQGIPVRYLISNTLFETLFIMIVSICIAGGLAALTGLFLPQSVPMYFDTPLLTGIGLAIIITGTMGALIPIRIISKIEPISAIGG
ncbi:ABC transporter permease [Weissella diestrammenae]|uniref:Putative hemin transport system permease protein HrtB n=1 Tax=Weissella diestrammenae TaxID=1162633 RepID=A0A7G9T5A6_9LACO|nr:ABC transporter permease [Weissella diestrammenae]MCM0583139.1 ABC transporter permease [Weissella diestrammenae]QNN75281.1 ABC transporter permease [Weissella diestrammenae]